MSLDTLSIAKNLIARESVTPNDGDCQAYFKELLGEQHFQFEHMDFHDTKNLWAIEKNGSNDLPVFVFAGHTDVVPPGNLDKWNTPPFEPTVINGVLYGRGAADMKGSLAAMLSATNLFIADFPEHQGRIAFLITSDEEGPFINGTIRVVEELQKRQQRIDYALVGEPSSTNLLGDVIKIGRRGSLTGTLKIHGIQGHVAYPHLAENAIHTAAYFLEEITKIEWDQGNEHFPPTSLQITSIQAGEASNVIPGEIDIEFNFRFSTEYTPQQLKDKTQSFVDKHCKNSDLEWKINGEPFITESKELIEATKKAIFEVTAIETSAETSGGTSDGRFIAKTGAQIVELGPINSSIHQVNEFVAVEDLEKLSQMYYLILKNLMVRD
ncbi:MAG: succinyl-diaminopimelate desuccinylase [Kangiellaceae bacterium]|nr:succinyl-diaminopimelate desuccinylase [Kangiellaceae bacterium]